MRQKKHFYRSTHSIVQQTNTVSTKQMLIDYHNGRGVDLPQGAIPKTYDCDSQAEVDFDSARFEGFESLIDQHCNANKITEHLSPPSSAPAPVPDPVPVPVPDPTPAE